MKFIRKLMLLSVLAAAAATTTAGGASAAVEVKLEATGAHCGAVTYVNHGASATGCPFHWRNNGPVEITNPVGMITCTTLEVSGHINEAGQAEIEHILITGCSSSIVECNEGGVDDNWPVRLNSESAVELSFCVTAFGFLNIACTIESLSVTDNASHSGDSITTGPSPVACDEGGGNSLQGTWLVENGSASEPEIEIVD